MSPFRHFLARTACEKRRQAGSALLVTLLLLTVIGAAVASVVPLAALERLLSAAVRDAEQCRYAAEAMVAYGMADLQARVAWNPVLDGSAPAVFRQAAPVFDLPRGRVDLGAVAVGLGQAEPGAWGADTPVWTLHAWGPARDLAPAAEASPVHVALWAADDERDGDGDPFRDANGRILLRAEAFGPTGGRRGVLVLVARGSPAPAALRVLDWREP